MALDFKQTTKKPHWKPKSRGTEWFKNIEGNHMPTRKLLHHKWVGSYAWIRCNFNRWLHKQLDRPIDDVFSDFVKEFKKSFRGTNTPEEIFYQYVDKEKNNRKKYMYWPWFYVSKGGFLCEYRGKVSCDVYNKRRRAPQAHVDFNTEVLKDFKIEANDYGPRYIGKLWAKARGFTKVMSVWLVRENKLTGKSEFGGIHNVSKAERSNLESFTTATIEGYGSVYKVKQPMYSWEETVNYRFIVKLSDLK